MIICGWTRYPPPATIAALSWYPHQLQYVGDRDDAYFDFLQQWWTSQEREIVTVEHDIVPQRELIEEMLNCERAWCSAIYQWEGGATLQGLGLCKFSLSIRRAVPDLFDRIADKSDDTHPPKHWCRLDAWIQRELERSSGETVCVHRRLDLIEHTDPNRSHATCFG